MPLRGRSEMRRKLIAGNWKMNGSPAEARDLIGALLAKTRASDRVEVVVCPPYVSLPEARRLLEGSHIRLGAQDMSQHPKGAYTGDISAGLLLTVGVTHVILGHSERRQYHAETDSLVNAKVLAALNAGLTPIICVGELLAERESGRTETVIRTQVTGVLQGLDSGQLGRVVIAYEPVWAIGTGKVASPEQAREVHRLIRELVAAKDRVVAQQLPILYGGSVKADNARGLMAQPDIDGALVGGASLSEAEFVAIINAA